MNEQEANEESMETSSVVPEGVRELLEQRSTYRTWLERLDEVGQEYRPAVAERVRSDYEDRLAGVAQELEGHRHEIETSASRRRARLDDLSDAFETRSAELEEAELRFQVGEFDDGTWEERRTELNEGLEEIESELAAARGAVEELEQILGELADDAGPSAHGAGGTDSSASTAGSRPPLKALDGGLSAERGTKEPTGDELSESEEAEADDEEESVDIEAASAIEEVDPGPIDDEVEPEAEPSVAVSTAAPPEREGSESASEDSAEADDYRDELEFLESLSLDDPDSFDAVSRMLEDEEDR